MKKRLLSLLCVVCLLMTALPTGAFAVEGEETLPAVQAAEGGETKEKTPPDDRTDGGGDGGQAPLVGAMTVTEFVTLDPDELDGISDAELLEGYLYSVSGLYGGASPLRAPARPLTGELAAVYSDLKAEVEKVAAGTLASTEFHLSKTWSLTPEDWGISNPDAVFQSDGKLTDAAKEAVDKKLGAGALLQRLLSEMPYELYWFDKTKGMSTSYSYKTALDNGKLVVMNPVISMNVSKDYSKSGVTGICEVDTTKTSAVAGTPAKANAVVTANASKSDYNKLEAYRKYITDAVSYNEDAAKKENNVPYGDPWQLIYVFDDKNDTNVVCEGYAKAFQYLCDLSSFNGPVSSALVTGTMTGGTGEGLHMWNVVSIGNTNYLVDVTNCDEGSVGAPNKLFLCGVKENEASKKYTATVGNTDIVYVYDKDTLDNYNEDELKLSTSAYTPPAKLSGKVTIDGTPKINVPLTADTSGITSTATGTLSYKWYRVKDGKQTLIDGATEATYTPSTKDDMGKHIMVEVTAENYSGSVQDMTGSVVVKGAGSAAPIAAPTLESRTANSITVSHTLSGLEFACVKAGASSGDASWQENTTFNNLEDSTKYNIYARSKATDTHEAGDPSPALEVKAIASEDLKELMKKSHIPYNGMYDGKPHSAFEVAVVPSGNWEVLYGGPTGGYVGPVTTVTNVSDSGERWVWFKHKDNAYEPVGIPYEVKISPKTITPTITLSPTSFTYDGSAKTPTVTVTDGTTVLTESTDYTVQYANNTDAGTAKVTVTEVEQGNYTWSPAAETSFDIANATITTDGAFENYSGNYDGKPHGITVDTSKIITVNGQSPEIKYSSDGSSYTLDASPTITNASGSPMTVYWQVTAPNHEPAKGSATITINKIQYTGTTTFAETVRSGQVTTNKTLPLPSLPDGASYGTPSSSDALIAVGTMSIDSNTNTLTYSTTSQADNTSATITIPVTGATNYNNYEVTVTITATALPPAVVSTAPTAKSLTYNGGEQALVDAGTATGGEMRYSLTSGSSYSENIPVGKNANKYTVYYIVKGDGQHSDSEEKSVQVTIAPKPVTIIGITAKDKVYDGTNNAEINKDNLRISGLVDGDNVFVDGGNAAFADKHVGTGKTVTFSGYTLKGNDGAENNYALTQPASVTANITAKEVTIIGVTAANREYDKTNLNVSVGGSSVTVDGAILGDNVTVNMYNAKGTMADANAGTGKSVTVTGCALDGTDAGNYKLKEQPTGVTVNITPAPYVGTTTASGSAKYGTSGTVDLSGLIVAGGTASYKSVTDTSSVLNGTPAMDGTTLKFAFADNASNATKTADIVVTVTSTNYQPYDITVTVTVNAKTVPTVTAPTAKTLIYNGGEQVLITAGSTTGGTLKYSLTSGSGYDTVLPKGKDAKSYTVYYKVIGDGEYADTAETGITVAIAKKAVTVAPKAVSITKGSAIPTFELVYTGLVSGESLTPSAAPTFTCYETGTTTPVSTSTAAGSYTITWTNKDTTTFTGADNYDVTKTATANLTISNPPVTPPGGGGSSSGGSSSDGSSSDSGTVKTETTKNDDGSTTRTETKRDGTVIETTTGKDGSVSKTETKTETKKDGTKVETRAETVTNKDGSKSTSKTEITTAKDGTVTESKSETRTGADGTKSVTKAESKTDKNGATSGTETTTTTAPNGSTGTTVTTTENGSSRTEAETTLSSKAVEEAKRNGEPVKAPVEVEAARNSDSAPTVKIELPKSAGDTKVEIPVTNVKPGTVAVIVHPDGIEEIVKDSIPTENGVQLTVSGGATVKILDNSKDFGDIQSHWAKDAIDFVSARGLVNGINPTLYSPNASATRAQLWTILARQADAELNGGANWYEKAQNWAKDKGISDGADPNGTINRAQMVTMLWRAMGEPVAEITHSFTDIAADNYYAQAVAWAVRNGITTGVGDGRFDPNGACTRGQIAAFLMRYCSAK